MSTLVFFGGEGQMPRGEGKCPVTLALQLACNLCNCWSLQIATWNPARPKPFCVNPCFPRSTTCRNAANLPARRGLRAWPTVISAYAARRQIMRRFLCLLRCPKGRFAYRSMGVDGTSVCGTATVHQFRLICRKCRSQSWIILVVRSVDNHDTLLWPNFQVDRYIIKLCHSDMLSIASKCDITRSQLSSPACVRRCMWAAFSSAVFSGLVIIPAKARDYVFTGVGLSVSLSVCLSVCFVTTITK